MPEQPGPSRRAAEPSGELVRRGRLRGRRESPRRSPLTVERIVASALAIIDAEGTTAVTMRRVAADLGVTASSLYEHVGNREELLDLAADAVIREIGEPTITGDWRADLRSWYVRAHEVYQSHGDIAALHFGAIPSRPQRIVAMERMLTAVIAGGVPAPIATFGIERLSLYTVADAYEGWEFQRRSQGAAVAEIMAGVRDAFDELPADEFPATRQHARLLMEAGGEKLFAAGLDLILAGMAAMAAEEGSESQPG